MITSLEQTITTIAARCMRTGMPIHLDTPFAVLGLDSLATIELAAALETELGCELPADILAASCTARTLAVRIARGRIAQPPDPFGQMYEDARLPVDIQPSGPARRTTDLRQARNILITGATGFLGAALLDQILANTSATLFCLVRGGHRLRASARVRCVDGNLEHARLGLSEADYGALVEDLDAIVHCGAAVNWVFPYGGLRAANVGGTIELLRLACRAGASFHFVSSASVCYAQDGPATADESFDALPHLRQVHLGYAQTKTVGEALTREAGARGLPIRIYRPALISGHSATGAFNHDDLIATLVRGCVAMGTAPDLDWRLDAVPVDVVAASVLELSRATGLTSHIVHPQPRHWRECVLWMRIYGYDVRLVSYPAWLRQLEAEARPATDHPLRPLRSFFLDRPKGAGGLTLPELYEDRRRTRLVSCDTDARLAASGVTVPPLDANLLDTYFGAFVASGDLPPVDRNARGTGRPGKAADIARLSGASLLSAASGHSIVSELTAWRSGRPSGLWRGELTRDDGAARQVMVKLKATDEDVIAVGEAIADVVDPRVAAPYRRWSRHLGFVGSHIREIAIYQQQDPRFLAHTPQVITSVADGAAGTWLLVQEHMAGARLLDSANDPGGWTSGDIATAIEGLAALHSIWFARDNELRAQPWIGHVHSTASMAQMSEFWIALADHAAPLVSSWTNPDTAALHRHLAAHVGWWAPLESGGRTLIHGDFNPRNICLRESPARLCAYDWELACLGAPQRDLAEFLCFVLLPQTAGDAVHWIEQHRQALSRETGTRLDQGEWMAGFRAAMCDLLINRLAIYLMVHRIKPQRFLPRVIRTWRAVAQVAGCEALA